MNYLDLLFVLLNGVFGVAILFFIAYDKLAHELGVLFKLGLWACGLGILLQAFGSAGVFFSVSPQIKPQYDHNNVAIWILSAGTWIMSIACSRLQFKNVSVLSKIRSKLVAILGAIIAGLLLCVKILSLQKEAHEVTIETLSQNAKAEKRSSKHKIKQAEFAGAQSTLARQANDETALDQIDNERPSQNEDTDWITVKR